MALLFYFIHIINALNLSLPENTFYLSLDEILGPQSEFSRPYPTAPLQPDSIMVSIFVQSSIFYSIDSPLSHTLSTSVVTRSQANDGPAEATRTASCQSGNSTSRWWAWPGWPFLTCSIRSLWLVCPDALHTSHNPCPVSGGPCF